MNNTLLNTNFKINNMKYEIIKEKVVNELMYLRYDIAHKGTIYLQEIITIVYLISFTKINNYSKQVYPIIAKEYNQKINNIKSNVIRATEAMFFNCEEKRFKEYFGYYDSKKPKTKEVVNTIILKISRKK